jgi:hypothetical protein
MMSDETTAMYRITGGSLTVNEKFLEGAWQIMRERMQGLETASPDARELAAFLLGVETALESERLDEADETVTDGARMFK